MLDASPVQYLEKQSKSVFPGPFPDASFVGDEPSCSFVVRSTQGCYLLCWGGEKKTKSWQLVQVLPTQANQPTYPKTYPMPCLQGYWCPQAELQQTSSFSQPSPPGQRTLTTERERAHRKARDSYTFRKRKHIWISLEQYEENLFKVRETAGQVLQITALQWLPRTVW